MNETQSKAVIKSFICNTTTFNEKYYFPIDEVVEIVNDYLKSSKPTEYILCASIHFDDGEEHDSQPENIKTGFVTCGRRHDICYETYFLIRSKDLPFYPHIQGFITNTNRFVDRKEACKIANNANQLLLNYERLENDILISEDLY